jgi:hypothetical protein
MKKCSAPSPFCECPKCFHAKHNAPAVVSSSIVRLLVEDDECTSCGIRGRIDWLKGPLMPDGLQDGYCQVCRGAVQRKPRD